MSSSFNNDWSDDIEIILNKIRINCITLSNYNNKQYYKYKGYLKYFRIPTIILSAVGSVVSVGFKPYMSQNDISITTCFIGLTIGIVNSIELFLTIQTIMEKSLTHCKDYYILSISIYKMLILERNHRVISGRDFLETSYTEYCKLIETSDPVDKNLTDNLLPIDEEPKNFFIKRFKKIKNKMDKDTNSDQFIESNKLNTLQDYSINIDSKIKSINLDTNFENESKESLKININNLETKNPDSENLDTDNQENILPLEIV